MSSSFKWLQVFLGCGHITPLPAPSSQGPLSCVSVSPLLILIRTLVIGLGSSMSSSQDPSVNDSCKDPFSK